MYYFFKKQDGEIFSCEAQHAHNYYGELTYLGAVEKNVVREAYEEGKKKLSKLESERNKLYEREGKIQDSRERLLTEEFLPEDDPKVQRAEKRLEEIHEKIDEKSEELSQLREKYQQKANKKALEEADTSITPPNRNYRAFDKKGREHVGDDAKKVMKGA